MKTYNLELILPNINKQISNSVYQKVKNKLGNQIKEHVWGYMWRFQYIEAYGYAIRLATLFYICLSIDNANNRRKP